MRVVGDPAGKPSRRVFGGHRMKTVIASVAALAVASQAFAADLILYPVQTGHETIRYRTGIPTLSLSTPTGAVTIAPLPLDHNHATFAVAVYNKSNASANFGIENITATVNGVPLPVLSREELQRRAKNRATWSAIGIALLSGVAAAAASSAYTTSHSYGNVRTPAGTYHWAMSYRDPTIGAVGASMAASAGVAGIVGVQNRLDYTLGTLAGDILQTTTVDPDDSYGGEVVVEKPRNVGIPYDVTLTMHWNATDYPFVFRMTEQGKNKPPEFTPSALGVQPGAADAAGPSVAPPTPPAVTPGHSQNS